MDRRHEVHRSRALARDMELLQYGNRGRPLLAFPISMGRHYLWEDHGLVDVLTDDIESGAVQLCCVDGVDAESWYDECRSPGERVRRHLQYESYILDEVLPRFGQPPVCLGTSFGALHSVALCLRHPDRFGGFVAMSGVYDTSRWLDGHHDNDTYFTNPLAFVRGLHEERHLAPLRAMEPKVIVTGTEDPNVGDSIELATQLRSVGVEVRLELWQGWLHDWPHWKEMLHAYV